MVMLKQLQELRLATLVYVHDDDLRMQWRTRRLHGCISQIKLYAGQRLGMLLIRIVSVAVPIRPILLEKSAMNFGAVSGTTKLTTVIATTMAYSIVQAVAVMQMQMQMQTRLIHRAWLSAFMATWRHESTYLAGANTGCCMIVVKPTGTVCGQMGAASFAMATPGATTIEGQWRGQRRHGLRQSP